MKILTIVNRIQHDEVLVFPVAVQDRPKNFIIHPPVWRKEKAQISGRKANGKSKLDIKMAAVLEAAPMQRHSESSWCTFVNSSFKVE